MPILQKAALLLLTLALLGAGALFYRMVDHMGSMTSLMGRMAEDISTMSSEIGQMNREFGALRDEVGAIRGSVEKMEYHMSTMGQPFAQGPDQIKKVIPMPGMGGVFPGQR